MAIILSIIWRWFRPARSASTTTVESRTTPTPFYSIHWNERLAVAVDKRLNVGREIRIEDGGRVGRQRCHDLRQFAPWELHRAEHCRGALVPLDDDLRAGSNAIKQRHGVPR